MFLNFSGIFNTNLGLGNYTRVPLPPCIEAGQLKTGLNRGGGKLQFKIHPTNPSSCSHFLHIGIIDYK